MGKREVRTTVSCGTCSGSGTISRPCPQCSNGFYNGKLCDACGGSGTYSRTCANCHNGQRVEISYVED